MQENCYLFYFSKSHDFQIEIYSRFDMSHLFMTFLFPSNIFKSFYERASNSKLEVIYYTKKKKKQNKIK